MIKISIVIPTYNRPESLEACCASIIREVVGIRCGTLKKMVGKTGVEIIVVDDGSTPEAAEKNRSICDTYGATYCPGSRNRGMAIARNTGITASSGRWIVFLDDDVTCDDGWYATLQKLVGTLRDDTAGFEGRVNPSGNGVWDREVQNVYGGAYLTCHFGVRKSMIDSCGMFDPGFAATGPYCEDHEFAARLMTVGSIPFITSLSVTHAPRNVDLWRYIGHAPKRCRQLLLSDCYFYFRQPDKYQQLRSHHDFFGTYRAYLVRHIIDSLKRRDVMTLFSHPLQAAALITGTIIEQCMAWLLIPWVVLFVRKMSSSLKSPSETVDIRHALMIKSQKRYNQRRES